MSETPPHNDQWPWPDDLDACIAAPASHHVLFENDAVRVLEVIIEPGTREPIHTHRAPSVMIVDRPARIRYDTGDALPYETHGAAVEADVVLLGQRLLGDPAHPHLDVLTRHRYSAAPKRWYAVRNFATSASPPSTAPGVGSWRSSRSGSTCRVAGRAGSGAGGSQKRSG